jgi:ubiquitin carboxyl-terminal hydrolase L3
MPLPVRIINGKKTFTVLGTLPASVQLTDLFCSISIRGCSTDFIAENNPEVMNALSTRLGLSSKLKFYDVYSLTDPSLLALIPRPVYALLVIIPMTPSWHASRISEDTPLPSYTGSGSEEPVIWFKQTIGEACGSIGLLHCLINGPAKEYISEEGILEAIRRQAIPLGMEQRAKLLYDSKEFEEAHQEVAEMGDTVPPVEAEGHQGHFVAFVKEAGRLWELEGSRVSVAPRAR